MNPEPVGQPIIEFRNASYRLRDGHGGGAVLLDSVSLTVSRGETLVLLGRSGAGKTTALKLINRLLDPSGGEVFVEEKSTLAWDPIALRRGIGYVIQETGLFPHYTVAENVALVPRLEKWPPERVTARVNELLALVGLSGQDFLRRYPHELSGGQRQRVGLARALAADPAILLMDEPFGALDPLTRAEIRKEFQDLKQRLGKTIVIVTHDIHEAVLLGTRIALMDSGRVTGSFSPKAFLDSNEPVAAAFAAQLRELESVREERARGNRREG
jgi:osmoprotectant transport system ATP-binding protein